MTARLALALTGCGSVANADSAKVMAALPTGQGSGGTAFDPKQELVLFLDPAA